MSFIKLTKSGEDFIINRCVSATTLFTITVTKKNPLPKSNVAPNTVFTAHVKNDSGVEITSNLEYAKQLIKWFNEFAELFVIDANIAASQAFIESKFYPTAYDGNGRMGISGIIDYEIFKFLIKANDFIKEEDVDDIEVDIDGDKDDIRTYIPNVKTSNNKVASNATTNTLARENRAQLFQNMIDNPKLSIFSQCYLLSLYGANNNNMAASTLFAYYIRTNEKTTKYIDLVNSYEKKNGKTSVVLAYVDSVFNVLGGKYPNVSGGFGYPINFDKNTLQISQNFTIDNNYLTVNSSVRLTSIIAKAIKGLDSYFGEKNLYAVVTSGFRDKHRQLIVINNYLKREKLNGTYSDSFTSDVDDKNSDGTYRWQLGWSALMNRGYIVNPPIGSKLLLDSTRNGKPHKPAGTFINTTPHSSGRSFDISGASLDAIASAIEKAKSEGKLGIVSYVVERENNAVHVDCSETTKYDKADSEID